MLPTVRTPTRLARRSTPALGRASPAGKERAERLAAMLKDAGVTVLRDGRSVAEAGTVHFLTLDQIRGAP